MDRKRRTGDALRTVAIAGLLSLSSCSYLGARALDFLDPYRITVGAGTTVGLRAKNMGLWDTGLMMGVKPKASALGWKYGEPLFFNQQDTRVDADQAELFKVTSMRDLDYSDGSYYTARTSMALLPVFFSWVDATPEGYEWQVPESGDEFVDRHWIWSHEAGAVNHYAQVHSMDIELEVGLLLYLDLGTSPIEFFDFWLGIVGIDLADDDHRVGG